MNKSNVFQIRYLVFALLTLSPCLAFGRWVCTESSGYKSSDDTYFVCGSSLHFNESQAKALSFKHALNEFKEICDFNSSCRNYEVELVPHRTECTKLEDKYKCNRLFEFHITKNKKEISSDYEIPDFEKADIQEDEIDWNKVSKADRTDYTWAVGYSFLSSTFKDYSNLSGTGLAAYFSKRVFKYAGLEISGFWGDNGEHGQGNREKLKLWSYNGYSIGTPLYYSWDNNEIQVKPSYTFISSSVEVQDSTTPTNNIKHTNQSQQGFGVEFGYQRLFYFDKGDKYYVGFNPRLGVTKFQDSKDLKAEPLNYNLFIGITFGFR